MQRWSPFCRSRRFTFASEFRSSFCRKFENSTHDRPLVVEAGAQGATTETGKLKFIDNTVDTTTGTVKLKAEFDNPRSSSLAGTNLSMSTAQTGSGAWPHCGSRAARLKTVRKGNTSG